MATSTQWYTISTPNSDDYGGRVQASVMAEITSRSGRTANVKITGSYHYTGEGYNIYDNNNPWVFTIIAPWGNKGSGNVNRLDGSGWTYFSTSGTMNYNDKGDLTVEFGIHIDGGWLGSKWSPWYYLYADNIGASQSAPPAPTNVKAVLSGNSNVNITWNHVGGTSSKPLVGFWINKGEDEGVIQSSNINTKENASQRSFTYAGAVNKRYRFRVWAHGGGGSAYTNTPNFVYTKPAAITSATGGNLYFWQSANIFDIFVKCDRSAIKYPGKAQVQLYAGGAWQSTIYDASTGTSGDVKISSTTVVTALTSVFNSMADNSSNTTAIKGRVRYANADNSAYSDWKEFAITTHKVKTAQMYVAANGKTAAYTYTKDSSSKITKIIPNFSVNFRDDSGKGAYTYTKDSSGKITKITPNMVISYAK